jgi:glycosyltransferase involved in cell wall biosynthesis
MSTPRALAVVPALNEGESVAGVVSELRRIGLDVLVVDDGSTDATADAARRAGARVVSLPFNLGIGGAVQTGYLAALDGGYDVAIQVDGDGQHPAEEVAKLLSHLQGGEVDLVIGSRFLAGTDYRPSTARRLGIGLFAWVVSRIVGVQMTDTTSGFRAAGPRAIRLFARSYPHDYPEVEAVLLASRAGLQVREVSVRMRQRQGGVSSITPIRAAYYMIKVLLAVTMQSLRRPDRSRVVRA